MYLGMRVCPCLSPFPPMHAFCCAWKPALVPGLCQPVPQTGHHRGEQTSWVIAAQVSLRLWKHSDPASFQLNSYYIFPSREHGCNLAWRSWVQIRGGTRDRRPQDTLRCSLPTSECDCPQRSCLLPLTASFSYWILVKRSILAKCLPSSLTMMHIKLKTSGGTSGDDLLLLLFLTMSRGQKILLFFFLDGYPSNLLSS